MLLLIFPGESFLGGMEPWTPVCLLRIHSLTWLEQFKQIFLKFDWKYMVFVVMMSSVTLARRNYKRRAQTTQAF